MEETAKKKPLFSKTAIVAMAGVGLGYLLYKPVKTFLGAFVLLMAVRALHPQINVPILASLSAFQVVALTFLISVVVSFLTTTISKECTNER